MDEDEITYTPIYEAEGLETAYAYKFQHWDENEPGAVYKHNDDHSIKVDKDGKSVSIPADGLDKCWRIRVKFVQNSADVWFYKQDAETPDDAAQGDAVLGGTALAAGRTNRGAAFKMWRQDGSKFKYGDLEVTELIVTTPKNDPTEPAKADEVELGDYYWQEVITPDGYAPAPGDAPHAVTLTANWDTEEQPLIQENPVIRGNILIKKVDKDTDRETPQGDALFASAQFTVTNKSAQRIIWNGKEYAKDALITTVKITSGNSVQVNGLPYGTYEVKEIESPELIGYDPDLSWSSTVEIREAKTYPVDKPVEEPVWRGGLKLQKIDYDLTIDNGNAHRIDLDWPGPQGNGSLEGAEFKVFSISKSYVHVNGKTYEKSYSRKEDIGDPKTAANCLVTLVTDKDGRASTNIDTLPYGTYVIFETKPPEGYLVNPEFAKGVVFTIREKGGWHVYDGKGDFIGCEQPELHDSI